MFAMSDQIWKRPALTNDADPSNKISEILDMRLISIKKHEWKFGKSFKMLKDRDFFKVLKF